MNHLEEGGVLKIEGDILNAVNELMDILGGYAAETTSEEYLLQEGIEKTRDIAQYFLNHYPQIEGNLEQTIQEVLQQKMQESIQTSQIADLSTTLLNVIRQGILESTAGQLLPFEPADGDHEPFALFAAAEIEPLEHAPLEQQSTFSNEAMPVINLDEESKMLSPLEWSVNQIYPRTTLIPNYAIGDKLVELYLPEQSLAFASGALNAAEEVNIKKFWAIRGISLVTLENIDIRNHRAVERQITRQKLHN